MPHEPDAMRMIHEIRERLYEQRRGKSRAQVLEEHRRETLELAKKYGLEIAPLPEEKHQRQAS